MQSVQPGAPLLDYQTVIPLLWSSDDVYHLDEKISQKFEKEIVQQSEEISQPLPLGVLSERGLNSDLDVTIDHGKLIVIGNVDAITNHCIQALGNRYFLLSLLQYLLDDDSFPLLPSVEVSEYRLQVTKVQIWQCWKVLLIPSLLVICLALGVYIARRDS
jgi:hypothetical protein